jgi:hypothetical protein
MVVSIYPSLLSDIYNFRLNNEIFFTLLGLFVEKERFKNHYKLVSDNNSLRIIGFDGKTPSSCPLSNLIFIFAHQYPILK